VLNLICFRYSRLYEHLAGPILTFKDVFASKIKLTLQQIVGGCRSVRCRRSQIF
jgi:hypothetical protein